MLFHSIHLIFYLSLQFILYFLFLYLFLLQPMNAKSNLHEEEIPLLKIILLGQSGVGKSNILSRYVYDKFSYGANTTIGLEFVTKKMKVYEDEINLQIWDTAGQEKFRALNQAFYRNALGGLMVFSLGDRKSFEKVPIWIQEVKEAISQNTILILIGNKCDLKEQQVSVEEATEFAKKQNMAYFQTSAALNMNIEVVFRALGKKVYEVSKKKKRTKASNVISILSQYEQPDKKERKKKCCN